MANNFAYSEVQAAGMEVQFGAFKNEALAQQQIGKAKLLGIYDAQIKMGHHANGRIIYRTVVATTNHNEANKAVIRLKENGIDSIILSK
ncbi:MAG: SPOR domain-containing protein [Alysiella sp.]|uniref:SPOR domain-containing protein n=1 Tax=Alysiella sp. TaxID=1872483 RepID=UPI0026DC529D|nr:SPOR domain-containing protein [Alysiella sp.]MDO4434684.1 SPOR domain-containing protein [Alysiella sp.]